MTGPMGSVVTASLPPERHLCRVCWQVWTADGLCQAHRDESGEPKYPTLADLEYEAWRDGYRWERGHKIPVTSRAPR